MGIIKKSTFNRLCVLLAILLLLVIPKLLIFDSGKFRAFADVSIDNNIDSFTVALEQGHKEPNLNPVPFKPGCYSILSYASWCRVITVDNRDNIDGVNATLYRDLNEDNQKFDFIIDENGYYTIKNMLSGKVLEVYDNENNQSRDIVSVDYTGNLNQKWIIEGLDDYFTIKSAAFDLYMDIEDSCDKDFYQILANEKQDIDSQKWRMKEFGSFNWKLDTPIANGDYVFSCKAASSKAVDINDPDKAKNTEIMIFDGNRSDSQIFYFESDDSGYYTIKNKKTSMYLSAGFNGEGKLANVVQTQNTNKYESKWVVIELSNNLYEFQNASQKNLVLDLKGAFCENYNKVQLYESNKSDAQLWSLYNPTPKVENGTKTIDEGIYNLKSSNNQLFLNVIYFECENNPLLRLKDKDDSINQNFEFRWVGYENIGWYKIFCLNNNGESLTVMHNSVLPGAPIVFSNTEGDEALWSVVNDDNNNFYLINKGSGQYLSVDSMFYQTCTESVSSLKKDDLKWSLIKSNVLNEGYYIIQSELKNNPFLYLEANVENGQSYDVLVGNGRNCSDCKWFIKDCGEGKIAIQNVKLGTWLAIDNKNNNKEVVLKENINDVDIDQSLLWMPCVNKGNITLMHLTTNWNLNAYKISKGSDVDNIYDDKYKGKNILWLFNKVQLNNDDINTSNRIDK